MSMTIIPHALFKNHCECHTSCSLSSRTVLRVAIASLFCIGALVALGCLSAPISYIVGGVLALVALVILALVILALIFGEKKLPPTPRIIPESFAEVIGETYSPGIAAFVKEQQLTLAEFRQFSIALLCNISVEEKIKQLSSELQTKIKNYGINKLEDDLAKNTWPVFEDILNQSCPMYWLQKFISAGDPKVCQDLGLPKECYGYYWLGPLGHSTAKSTIFYNAMRNILGKLTKEDITLLQNKALQGQWDDEAVKEVIYRIHNTYAKQGVLTKEVISKELLLLSLHGYSFDQIQLITQLPQDTWESLCYMDNGTAYNLQLCVLGGALSSQNLLEETSKDFDINICLFVMKDLKEKVEVFKTSEDFQKMGLGKYLLQCLSAVSKRLASILRQGLLLRAIAHGEKKTPIYEVDFTTGTRKLTRSSKSGKAT
ncbi:DUF1389 domain-containing protein [Candidatus Chlamydia corallus]|uniref:DUF1389 domain-containing protein n=1 Tax=Candidatus Chlamydia corallus TaxID=2038470 RepID=UPI000C2FC955|nr:DUF1389 domain-containing protein [Candidatus Chlamydia corallus]